MIVRFLFQTFKYTRISRANTTEEKQLLPVQSLVQVARKASMAHRSRMDIIANILSSANNGARKTHIMYRCNLSFKQLHIYLAFLGERRLLKSIPIQTEQNSDSSVYQTTSKGRAFLQAYSNIRVLLSNSEFEDWEQERQISGWTFVFSSVFFLFDFSNFLNEVLHRGWQPYPFGLFLVI